MAAPLEAPFHLVLQRDLDIPLESVSGGTRYTATVQHASAEDRDRHAAMGFHEGWGQALDQLVALVKQEAAGRTASLEVW